MPRVWWVLDLLNFFYVYVSSLCEKESLINLPRVFKEHREPHLKSNLPRVFKEHREPHLKSNLPRVFKEHREPHLESHI